MAQQPIFSKQFRILIDSSTVAMATDFSLDFTKDMIEVSYLSDEAYKTNIPDLKSWSVNFSGLRGMTKDATTATIDYEAILYKMMTSDTSVAIAIRPRQQDVSTNNFFIGGGFLSSLTQSGGVGAAVTYSGTVVGAGPLTMVNNSTN